MLQMIVRSAQDIIGTHLGELDSVYNSVCLQRGQSIIKDPYYPSHHLFNLRRSGRRLDCKTFSPLTLYPGASGKCSILDGHSRIDTQTQHVCGARDRRVLAS
ncbi:laminin subunit beta-4 [Tachysurus ichikawai]